MINVLINAYAVSPSWGSEPGMGWNWILCIAKHCNVHVITEGEWKEEILNAIKTLPYKDNFHFYFNPVPDFVRSMCWNQGDWRFYKYYRTWQKGALKIAREIIANNQIDVIHQLNMIGFREPGYLWKIKDIPIVWGPIGGFGSIPSGLLSGAGIKFRTFCKLKNLITDIQGRFGRRVGKMMDASYLIAATPDAKRSIESRVNKTVEILNETGIDLSRIPDLVANGPARTTFDIIWVGKFDFRKRLDLALKAVACAGNKNIRLHICGSGTSAQISMYKALSKELNIDDQCVFHGVVPHENILQMMSNCDIMLFTSISDATSTVGVEAINSTIPVLSFNLCGFGPIVKDFGGVTVEPTDSHEAVGQFADKIKEFISNPELLQSIKERQRESRYYLSWDYKGKRMLEIYSQLLDNKISTK